MAVPSGVYWDARKGNGGGYRYLPGHRPHVGLGGSSRSCPHCGSLLHPRKTEVADTTSVTDEQFFGDIDFAMID